MGYISFNLQVEGKPILVIGGGAVAQRKVLNILPASPQLTVISPTLTFELQQLRQCGSIAHIARMFTPEDIDGAFLVIAATNDRAVNRLVAAEAISRGILVEVTDSPGLGTITSPAVLRQGDLTIAISTNNRSPALSAVIKRELTPLFGPEYIKALELLGGVREKLLTGGRDSTYNKQVLCSLAEQLPALFASGAYGEIDSLLQRHLGAACTLASFDLNPGDST